MARFRVRVNDDRLKQALRTPVARRAVHEAAEQVAENVRSQSIEVGDRDAGPYEEPLPVEVQDGLASDGRPASFVVLAHPSGQAVQAKHGALTKAAAQAGLKVRSGGE